MHHWFINSFVIAVRPVWTHSTVLPSRLIEGLHLLCTHVKHWPWERHCDLGVPATLISSAHHKQLLGGICHVQWHHCIAAPAELPIRMFTSLNVTSTFSQLVWKKQAELEQTCMLLWSYPRKALPLSNISYWSLSQPVTAFTVGLCFCWCWVRISIGHLHDNSLSVRLDGTTLILYTELLVTTHTQP